VRQRNIWAVGQYNSGGLRRQAVQCWDTGPTKHLNSGAGKQLNNGAVRDGGI
jgi:hypothetical protein